MPQPTIQELMRDAAVERDNELRERDQRVIEALGLWARQRAEQVIHLSETTAIVEVTGLMITKPTTHHFTVVHEGVAAQQYVETLPMALLFAAHLMSGLRPQDRDYEYAGRVLGIKS
jgi:hypothetical protein